MTFNCKPGKNNFQTSVIPQHHSTAPQPAFILERLDILKI